MRSLGEVVLIVFGALGILALARQALEPAALEAVAIPNAQEDVDTFIETFNQEAFVIVPNSLVTINNGTQTRRVVIQFSSEVRVNDSNDRMELGYALNNGGGSVCFAQAGPLNFATGTWGGGSLGFSQSQTAIHVPTLGRGTWTIQPCVRMVDGDSDGFHSGILGIRTLTAEVMTK